MWAAPTSANRSATSGRPWIRDEPDRPAPAYGFGQSEEIVGKPSPAGARQAVIATKWAWNGVRARFTGTRAGTDRREIDDSLRRLRTDYVDIYQVHWPDPVVPIEETARRCTSCTTGGRSGDRRHNFGCADGALPQRCPPARAARRRTTCFERSIEARVLPYCRANNIVTLGYGALCRGLLSGASRRHSFQGTICGSTIRNSSRPAVPNT